MTGDFGLEEGESTKEAAISWEVWRLGLESREAAGDKGLGKIEGGGFKGGRGFSMARGRIRQGAGGRQGGFGGGREERDGGRLDTCGALSQGKIEGRGLTWARGIEIRVITKGTRRLACLTQGLRI